ncbi:MAG: aminotransferase class V-fold PLP-dependent enzyme [Longimicrobiales bacterium]
MTISRRADFHLPENIHYLNCAYMSPLARRVEQAGVAGVRRKRDPTTIAAADFFTEADRARALFARLVNAADAARVAVVPSVSYAVATAIRNLDVRAGRNVVVAAEQFPSNVLGWRSLCQRRGAELRTVSPDACAPPGRAELWNARLLEAIDESTAVVALPHVHWTDGTRFELEAIGRRAREVDAAFIVDGTQSVGALPFDVAGVRPDLLVAAGYKWLLGPYGLGLAWLGERFDGGVPLEETWLGREGSEDFRALVDYRDTYRPGAERYDMGERSSFHLMPMLVAALELLLEWGVPAIQDHCRGLADRICAGAAELGFTAEHETGRASHLFGLRGPAGLENDEVRGALERRRVIVSLRGSAIRVSPHVYNDEADADALIEALGEVA